MQVPASHEGIHYTTFIAELIRQREATTYLEIGVQAGHNLAAISVDTAIGIDPAFNLAMDATAGKRRLLLHRMSSDMFFARCKASEVDVAFLDGMHLCEYLMRDFYNTEACCNVNGVIFLHDCLPYSADLTKRVDAGGPWTGDVWKAVAMIEKYRPDLKVISIDCPPTGLIAITNLDPTSLTLRSRYCELCDEMRGMPNDENALLNFYSKRQITKSADILKDFNQSLYFRS